MKPAIIVAIAALIGSAVWIERASTTEYERAVAELPPALLEGGCHNPGNNPDTPAQRELRRELTDRYGWPILTAESADAVALFVGSRGAVDFGAGSGYFAHLLSRRGIDVAAIDDWSGGKPETLWHPVEQGSFERLKDTSDRVLILSWPPRDDIMAYRAIWTWGGSRLVYAGEIMRGTADPTFHNELADNWHLVAEVSIPQWRNRSDAIYLFERRDGAGDGWQWMNDKISSCTYEGHP